MNKKLQIMYKSAYYFVIFAEYQIYFRRCIISQGHQFEYSYFILELKIILKIFLLSNLRKNIMLNRTFVFLYQFDSI